MLPTILLWGHFPIHLYAVLNFFALNLGIVLLLWRIKVLHLDLNLYLNLSLLVLAFGLLGGRGLAIFLSPIALSRHDLFSLTLEGGFSFLGALTSGTLAFILYLRWRKISVWATSDVVAPLLPFVQSVSKLGCFLAGCCHGVISAMGFFYSPENLEPQFWRQKLFPVQLLEASAYLFLGIALFFLSKKMQYKTSWLTIAYVFLFGFLRFCVDFFRWYSERWYGLSSSQIFCLGLMLGSVVVFLHKRKHAWS